MINEERLTSLEKQMKTLEFCMKSIVPRLQGIEDFIHSDLQAKEVVPGPSPGPRLKVHVATLRRDMGSLEGQLMTVRKTLDAIEGVVETID